MQTVYLLPEKIYRVRADPLVTSAGSLSPFHAASTRSIEAPHVLTVGDSGLNPITARADLELVEALRRSWRQSIADRFLGYRLQRDIAAQTPPKWGGTMGQIESPQLVGVWNQRL